MSVEFSGIIKNKENLKLILTEKLVPLIEDRTIVLLEGEVGVGKTELVRIIAMHFHMLDIASPSFAIHHRYENNNGNSMDHIDLYRLKDSDDLESTGFWDLFSQSKSLIVIEWSDRLNLDYLPLSWKKIKVKLKFVESKPEQRWIEIDG